MITSTEFDETLSEKFPSRSVMVPLLVPFSTTLAPIMAKPDGSVTVPVMVDFAC